MDLRGDLMRLKFDVPVPPSINHCYWYRNGKRYRTESAKQYSDMVKETVRQVMHKQKIKKMEDKRKIRVEMTYYFPDNRIRDTHNSFKILLDALESEVYHNDYWVLLTIKDFIIDKANPHVHIEIFYEGE
jgi:Holliday junction resolvase RusA-like endonuclease